jgi:hypothetical protein
MNLFIAGEDDACRAVIYRVIAYCFDSRKQPYHIISELPARGGEVKSKIHNFNILSATTPVVLLMDFDNNTCPPTYINTLIEQDQKNDDFILSLAVDEVEAWLLADRDGFARYFNINIDRIPSASKSKMQGRVEKTEIFCPYKTSLYFITQILPHSRNKSIIAQLTPRPGATKGPEYNTTVIPFIKDHWNIENAMANSDSLTGMIHRIFCLIDNGQAQEL